MVSVLHIVNRWGEGGVERFVEGVVADCSGDAVRHSILSVCTDVRSDADCPAYGPLHDGASIASMLAGARALGGFLGERGFDAVHIHTNNSSGFLYAAIARGRGVPCRIVHSHNSSLGIGSGAAKRAAQALLRGAFGGSETLRLACSREAGEHLFPGRSFRVIPNGVDVARFRFDPLVRGEIRRALGMRDGEALVGCVGSLSHVKNHLRAVAVFDEYRKRNPRSKLLILGDGELRGAIEREASARGLADTVLMPGFVEDAHLLYSAMDVLLFPSLHEGLPIALVEAQCNGLPVVCSDAVTDEAALLDSFTMLPLSAPNADWADALARGERDTTGASADAVCMRGFDRKVMAVDLLKLYERAKKTIATTAKDSTSAKETSLCRCRE